MSNNSELAVRALHALAGAEMDVLERLYSREFVFHMQVPGRPQGYAGLRDRALMINSALYDVSISVKVVLDEGDTVVTRWRGRAVHKGDLLGMPGTGRRIAVNGMTILRIRDGVITEEWTEFDGLALLNQLRAAEGIRGPRAAGHRGRHAAELTRRPLTGRRRRPTARRTPLPPCASPGRAHRRECARRPRARRARRASTR